MLCIIYWNVLHIACKTGNVKLVKFLISLNIINTQATDISL